MLNCVPCLPACQRGLPANVLSCEHTNVPDVPACYLIFPCQRPNECASVPNGVPTFQISASICQRTCQFFKHFSYEMLREISILYFCIKSSTLYLISYLYHTYIAHKNCIILNFRTSCHLKEMCVEFLFYETFLLFRKTWFLYVTSIQGFLELSTKTIKAKYRIRVNIVTILN